ncbi:MAG TPA: DUF2807 domain-containing protein [Sphingomicrobium sp.]
MRYTVPLFAFVLLSSAPVVAAEVVAVPRFQAVQLVGGGIVTIVPGATQRVTIVEGSSQFTRVRVLPDGKLKIVACGDRCPKVYRLRIEIQSPSVPDLAISGGGSITAQGGFRSQSRLSAAVNGGGTIDARAVDARTVSAAVNGGGEVRVRARSNLSAAVNGGGLVRFWGSPSYVSRSVHGGGAVSPAS